ncbi:hypothetical protein IAR55_000722 [Kwoniella newhampshirensis]|uniref:NAD-dependent epimerase/dehydratase domain-containing protein n=1 Tax=Kwoniella newhampshirensis TaxID=1651941 RepID=A0AAW0Z3W6_9TREE
MPTVLLTGITGFLATHVALVFLRNGWTVRGTLRDDTKKSAVLAVPEYAPYIANGKLELVITGPLDKSDYTVAVKGVDAVVHTSAPFEYREDEFRERHLAPAVKGTTDLLEAAASEESIKAVVCTGSHGAIGYHITHPSQQKGMVFDENNWNHWILEQLDEIVQNQSAGDNPYGIAALFYMGAKKYAELAAWDAQKAATEKGAKWSLAFVIPCMLFGPPIQPLSSLSYGGLSTMLQWALTKGKDAPIMETLFPYYVDVRDAAEAHYQAVVKQAQGRFLLAAGPYDFQEIADMLRGQFPEQKDRFPVGTPGKYMYKDPGTYTLKVDKSVKELGTEYRPKEETVKDAYTRLFELEKQGLE